MEELPAGRFETLSVATPMHSKVTVPSALVPLRKFTLPVGMEEPLEVTVAVSVTDWP